MAAGLDVLMLIIGWSINVEKHCPMRAAHLEVVLQEEKPPKGSLRFKGGFYCR
jgi:hypothetical protein